ncbi:hypothetical protein ACWA2B_10400 [Paenibacillus sp. CMM36]
MKVTKSQFNHDTEKERLILKINFEYHDCSSGYDWKKDRTLELSEEEITLLLNSGYINYQVGNNVWIKMYVNSIVTSIDEYARAEYTIVLNTKRG